MITLIFTSHPNAIFSAPIRGWEGDECTHVGVWLQRHQVVVHASAFAGVVKESREAFLHGRILKDQIDLPAASPGHLALAELTMLSAVGGGYDWPEVIGFPLLRDLGSSDRYVCSTLARRAMEDVSGRTHPGRRGRYGVRLARIDAAALRDGAMLGRALAAA